MITYICGSDIKYSEFPKAFWEDLEKRMEKGDEILLGDSDFAHRVYGRCKNKQYESVKVLKSVPQSRYKPYPRIKLSLPSSIKMLKQCDQIIVVWDGNSTEEYLLMLMAVSLHKKCYMFYLPSERHDASMVVMRPENLKPYAKENEEWTREDVETVLQTCGFSEQMIDHILEQGIPREGLIAEIICKAPVSLKDKLSIMETLSKKNNINYKAFNKVNELIRSGNDFGLIVQAVWDIIGNFGTCLEDCCRKIKYAEYSLKNSRYYLFAEWYDTDVFMEKSEPVGMFDTVEQALEYVKREDALEAEDGCVGEDWYRLEAWASELEGTWETPRYDFYIYKGEICWFVELRPDRQEHGNVWFMSGDREFFNGPLDLSISTPFKVGDIVNIDCRPFGPAFHAVVIEARDQFDCCMPQVLFNVPFTDKWSISALKHKHFYKDAEMRTYCPPLSPLYRLRSVKPEEMSKEDEILVKVSEALNGDEEQGRLMWNTWHESGCEGMTEQKVMEIVETIKGNGSDE